VSLAIFAHAVFGVERIKGPKGDVPVIDHADVKLDTHVDENTTLIVGGQELRPEPQGKKKGKRQTGKVLYFAVEIVSAGAQ